MDEHVKPRPKPPRDDPRDDVHVAASPVRCPFCHDDVAIEGAWSACSRCLARHHPPCWSEGGRCAACGHDGAVRHEREVRKHDHTPIPMAEAPPRETRSAERPRARRIFVGMVAAVALSFALLTYLRAVRGHHANAEAHDASAAALAEQLLAERYRTQPRPVGRYQQDGALIVHDGVGNFVAVFEADDVVVFGLGVVLQSLDRYRLDVKRPDGEAWVMLRPLDSPLIVLEGGSYGSFSARPGMSAREVTELLSRTRPQDLVVPDLLRRVQTPSPRSP